MARLVYKYFSSSGSWTAPAGVSHVWVIAHGGGSGGSGGNTSDFDIAFGGHGTVPYIQEADVTPNTSYTITIGAGGTGGAAGRSGFSQNGGVGGNTTFGALLTFAGAIAPSAASNTANRQGMVLSFGDRSSFPGASRRSSGYEQSTTTYSFAGNKASGTDGAPGYIGSTGGAQGAPANPGTGGDGTSATGFGAGGGGAGGGTVAGGTGGDGAPGQLWVMWVE